MTTELSSFLHSLGLEGYLGTFSEEGFEDVESLLLLKEEHLEKLGVKMNHRLKLLEALEVQRDTLMRLLPRVPTSVRLQPNASAPRISTDMVIAKQRGQIFLSYGHDPECTELARLLQSRLEPEFKVWMDEVTQDGRGIRFGDDWRERILEGVKRSEYMLALLSAHSTRKPGVCREEVALALGPLKSFVYSVLVQPVAEVTPPLILSQRQWLDMSEWRSKRGTAEFDPWFEDQLSQIVTALRQKSGFAGEMAELQQALNPLSQVSNHMEVESGFVGRQWLLGRLGEGRPLAGAPLAEGEEPLGEIERWAIDEPDKRVFWLCADPGWGKSAVMGRLAHAQRARVLAVHFCRHDEEDTRQAHRVICSIAYQMASQLPDFRNRLLDIVRTRTDWAMAKAGDLFRQLIQEPLAYTIDGGRAVAEKVEGLGDGRQHQRRLIVIDALDECVDEQGSSELLDVLSERFRAMPPWLGLVVSSRNEKPVVSRFRGFGMFELRTFDQANRADLRLYAHGWLQRLVKSGLLPAEQLGRALDSVCAASGGSFLYLRQLEFAVMQDGVVQVQELLTPERLPADLGAIYGRWFSQRFSTVDFYEGTALPMLELMVAAREPLPRSLVDQVLVDQVLGWDERSRVKVEGLLGALLREEHGRLQFFHKSLTDWLLEEDAAGPDWVVSERAGHRRFAEALWQSWDSTRREGALDGGTTSLQRYFTDWTAEACLYALRHLPRHLLKAGHATRQEVVLTDFPFAMQRCHADALDSFLADYRDAGLCCSSKALESWADAICGRAHKLRSRSDRWPADRALLQLALGHADNSHLTLSAKGWMDEGHCAWAWLPRTMRPRDFRSVRQPWVETVIPLGDQQRLELVSLDACWRRPRPLGVCGLSGRRGVGSLVRAFDLLTGRLIWQADLPLGKVEVVRLQPNSPEVAVRMDNGLILQGSIESAEPLREVISTGLVPSGVGDTETSFLPLMTSQASRLVRSQDGRTFVVACKDGSVWRRFSGPDAEPKMLAGPGPMIYGLAVSEDGNTIGAVGEGRAVRFWRGERHLVRLPGHAHRATRICVSYDGRRGLSAGHDGHLIVWNLEEATRASSQAFRPEITALAVARNEADEQSAVVTGDLEGYLTKCELSSKEIAEPEPWRAHAGRVWDMSLTPCRRHLVSVGTDLRPSDGKRTGSVAIWELATRRCVARYETESEAQAVAISPTGKHIVAATSDRYLVAWNLETDSTEPTLDTARLQSIRTRAAIRSLVFLDDQQFFSTGDDGVIRKWTIGADGCIVEVGSMQHGRASEAAVRASSGSQERGAYALALSPCKTYIACSGRGLHRAITVWKTNEPDAPVNVLFSDQRGSFQGTHFLSFMGAGCVWSANWDGSIVLWDSRETGGRQLMYQPEAQISVMTKGSSEGEFVIGTALGDVYSVKLVNAHFL